MTIKKIGNAALIMLTMAVATKSFAQSGSKRHAGVSKAKDKAILLPDFYVCEPIKKGDTTFTFECYDQQDKKMELDSLFNINNAGEIFIYKHYYQFPYKPGAIISPPYLAIKLYTFERTSKDTWLGCDLHSKVKTGVKEHMGTIARTDTAFITDPVSGTKEKVIHKYYKTDIVPADAVPEGHHIH